MERIQPAIEGWLGKSSAQFCLAILGLLVFTVLYTLIALGTAAGFLWLAQIFGGGITVLVTLAVPFGLVMLLEAGIVVKFLGGPVTNTAVGILEKLTTIFDPRKGRLTEWPTQVHAIPKTEEPEALD